MKSLAAVALLTVVLLPGAAFASSSTDAALGLGAFAVFNQILGGVGIFGGPARPVAVAPAPVVVTPPPPPAVVYGPPPVYVAPPAPVYYAPAPPAPVYYAPAPPAPVYYAPAPVVVIPRPVVVRRAVPVYRHGGWGHRFHR